MEGRRISHFRGKGELFQLTFGYESETAKHLFPKSTFQQHEVFKVQTGLFVCLFLKMRKGVCGVVVCVPGYRHKHKCLAYGSFFAFCPLLSASLLAVLWITRRSDCLTQGQNFEVKNVSFGMWNCHQQLPLCLQKRHTTTWESSVLLFVLSN